MHYLEYMWLLYKSIYLTALLQYINLFYLTINLINEIISVSDFTLILKESAE